MHRRLYGVVLVLGVVLLDPPARVPERTSEHDDVRLERLTAPVMPEAPAAARRDVRAISHDIPLSGDRKHLIVDAALLPGLQDLALVRNSDVNLAAGNSLSSLGSSSLATLITALGRHAPTA